MSTPPDTHDPADVSPTLRGRVSAVLDDLLPPQHNWESSEFTVAALRVRLRTRGLLADITHAPPVRDAIIRDVLRDRDAYAEPRPTTPACPTNSIDSIGGLVAHNRGDDR